MNFDSDIASGGTGGLTRGPSAVALRGPGGPARAGEQRDFASVLGRQGVGVVASRTGAAAGPEAQAREAAEQFVAIAMVQPILKEAREGTMAAGPFAPSSAERQFRALQDASVAQRITKAAHFPLVERLAGDLLRRTAARANRA